MLEAEIGSHDRAGRLQPIVDGRTAQRPGGGQLFVGIGEPEAARVVFRHLDRCISWRGKGAEARHVHRQDVLARVVVRHPARQHQADAAALAEPGHHRTGDPEIAQSAYRPHQRVAIRREGKRTVDRLPDSHASKGREMPEADLEVGRQPLEIIRQQLHRKLVRRLNRRPHHAVRLVGSDQRAAALLAHVDLSSVIGGIDDLLLAPLQFRYVLGNQVVVLHRQHR